MEPIFYEGITEIKYLMIRYEIIKEIQKIGKLPTAHFLMSNRALQFYLRKQLVRIGEF